MKVSRLIEILQKEDKNALVVISAPDHNFLEISEVCGQTALRNKGRSYSFLYEDHGDENKLEKEDKKVKVVLLD